MPKKKTTHEGLLNLQFAERREGRRSERTELQRLNGYISSVLTFKKDNGEVSKGGNCVTFSMTLLYESGLKSEDFLLLPLRSGTIEGHVIWIIHLSEKGN